METEFFLEKVHASNGSHDAQVRYSTQCTPTSVTAIGLSVTPPKINAELHVQDWGLVCIATGVDLSTFAICARITVRLDTSQVPMRAKSPKCRVVRADGWCSSGSPNDDSPFNLSWDIFGL